MVRGVDVYRKEIIEMKKILEEYRVLDLRQLYKYFWNKESEIVKKIIKYLARNGQIYIEFENNLVAINKEAYEKEKDLELIVAFDVMLLFADKLTYHTKYEYPIQICFLVGDIQYEVIYAGVGDEKHINTAMKNAEEDNVRYLVVIEELEQIEKLAIKDVYRYCIVDKDGKVSSYTIEEGNEIDKEETSKETD